jgi:hypothetical protein
MLRLLPIGSTLIAIAPNDDDPNNQSRWRRHPISELMDIARKRQITFTLRQHLVSENDVDQYTQEFRSLDVDAITSFDSMYYTGVAQFARGLAVNLQTRIVGTYSQYNDGRGRRGGRYRFKRLLKDANPQLYNNGEGYFTIGYGEYDGKEQMLVESIPAGNPGSYRHPNLGVGYSMSAFDQYNLRFEVVHAVKTGVSSGYGIFEAYPSLTPLRNAPVQNSETLAKIDQIVQEYKMRWKSDDPQAWQKLKCYIYARKIDIGESDEFEIIAALNDAECEDLARLITRNVIPRKYWAYDTHDYTLVPAGLTVKARATSVQLSEVWRYIKPCARASIPPSVSEVFITKKHIPVSNYQTGKRPVIEFGTAAEPNCTLIGVDETVPEAYRFRPTHKMLFNEGINAQWVAYLRPGFEYRGTTSSAFPSDYAVINARSGYSREPGCTSWEKIYPTGTRSVPWSYVPGARVSILWRVWLLITSVCSSGFYGRVDYA